MTIARPVDAQPMPICPEGQGWPAVPTQRILIVTDAWAPQVNGVVRSYENIIRELRLLGHDVAVISPRDFPTLPLPGYQEIALAVFPYRRLARMIARYAPDRIHIAVEGPLGWAARRYCLRHRRPYSTAFHTNFPAYIALRAPGVIRAPLQKLTLWVLRRFHDRAEYTYVATPSVTAQLRAWGFAGMIWPLSRGVDAGVFHPPAVFVRNDVPVLLYVGRVAAEKNLDAFLGLTPAQTGPVRKVVVGDGPALGALHRAYPDVAFLGTLTGQALADTYRAADVFVFPSRTDTFGIVLIEALASGLPIAAYDVPGPCDIVTDPSLGALDEDLGAAISRALDAPGTRQSRSAHAHARYSWAAVAVAFLGGAGYGQDRPRGSDPHPAAG
ncbi:MAG: glycosyltransferase family 1 protein [Proteobacteria bacterium]|nr:glycosyltransferase family 1 protein [Pseudomonadota bacterium]